MLVMNSLFLFLWKGLYLSITFKEQFYCIQNSRSISLPPSPRCPVHLRLPIGQTPQEARATEALLMVFMHVSLPGAESRPGMRESLPGGKVQALWDAQISKDSLTSLLLEAHLWSLYASLPRPWPWGPLGRAHPWVHPPRAPFLTPPPLQRSFYPLPPCFWNRSLMCMEEPSPAVVKGTPWISHRARVFLRENTGLDVRGLGCELQLWHSLASECLMRPGWVITGCLVLKCTRWCSQDDTAN